MTKYDFLIVGAGIAGATTARLLTENGYKCLIIEKDKNVGGLAKTNRVNDIDVHLYGPHIFHTSNQEVWNFVNRFATFHEIMYQPIIYQNKQIFQLPINMSIMNQLFNVNWVIEAQQNIKNEIAFVNLNSEPQNSEEYALTNFGTTIYSNIIKPYIEKCWKKQCIELPISEVKNINMQFLYNCNYFNDKWVAIPECGYTEFVENIIGDDIDIMLNKDYTLNQDKYNSIANYVIYTGSIDELLDYKYGELYYRTAKFIINDETEHGTNILGAPTVYCPDNKTEWYRMIEHKWLTPWKISDDFVNHTILTYEYPEDYRIGMHKLYALHNKENIDLYNRYFSELRSFNPKLMFLGRLANYTNYSMSETIERVMTFCNSIKHN